MTKALSVIVAFVVVGLVGAGSAVADEAPIAGTVKAIDASAKTLTLQTTAKGKTRDVTGGAARTATVLVSRRSQKPRLRLLTYSITSRRCASGM